MLSFDSDNNTEMTGNAPGKEGVVQQTNSSKDCLYQESTHAQETPRNEVSTEKAGCSPSKGAPVSTSTASEEVDRAVLHGESSKKSFEGRELSSINGLALGLCLGVAFGRQPGDRHRIRPCLGRRLRRSQRKDRKIINQISRRALLARIGSQSPWALLFSR